MRKTTRLFIIFLAVIAMSGCKKDKKYNDDDIIREIDITKKPTPTQIITPEPTKEPEIIEETHEGEMRSTLSGLWVPVEVGNRRPYAIQFSNFKTVRNQWGIGQADIVYEALVEGGITRFLAIGENFTETESVQYEVQGIISPALQMNMMQFIYIMARQNMP